MSCSLYGDCGFAEVFPRLVVIQLALILNSTADSDSFSISCLAIMHNSTSEYGYQFLLHPSFILVPSAKPSGHGH